MKIHMVVLYLYLLIIGANGEAKKKSGGRLTLEENKQRLRTCGTTAIDTPSRDNKAMELKKWPNWVSFAVTADQKGAGAALTTRISPRHFLTSSQVVMRDDSYTWRYEPKRVGNCRQMPQGNLEVSKEVLKNLLFFKSGCLPNCNKTSLIPVTRAVILNYCQIEPKMWWWSQAVMIMEIAEDIGVGGGFPCLAYETKPKGEKLDVYSYLWKERNNQSIYHRKLQLLNTDGMSYKFQRYNEDGERGSPVMKQGMKDRRWNLVGLGAQNMSDSETGVLRMSWIKWQLCREVGVCSDSKPPPPPPKPTDPPNVDTTTTPTTKKAGPPRTRTKKPNPPPVKQVPITVKPITPAPKPTPKPTVAARKLTKKENLRRLKNCGKTPIDTPSRNNQPKEVQKVPNWMLLGRTSGRNVLTTMISPRHFLTSSQVVMHDNTTWRWNSKKVESCTRENGQVNLEVPDEIVREIRLYENSKNSPIPVTRAVILNYCKIQPTTWKWSQGVMVMEIEKDIGVGGGFPCLADNSTVDNYFKGRALDLYSFSYQKYSHRRLSIREGIDFTTGVFLFPQYKGDKYRGGPIMDNGNGTWTLVALGAGKVFGGENSSAFGISTLQEQLCEVVGVCFRKDVPKLPPAKSPESTPTASGTPSKTPEAPPPPSASPPEPSTEAPPPRAAPPARRREDEKDDDDYEMFLKRKKEKEEAEMYENEDTDLLISKDDFNDCDGRRGGLRILLCAFFVLYWFLCE
ncbi:hypothetical protein CRE_23142 [Caenorhabditis remanei]|uniref:Uncharacterized protein n=1 Tax=Caenorhabditis remanei TaxID=31234 RepID=E3NFX6_CAERE|nr:hypothetical protein CRE_23142 [Caenorhabditis remanei]